MKDSTTKIMKNGAISNQYWLLRQLKNYLWVMFEKEDESKNIYIDDEQTMRDMCMTVIDTADALKSYGIISEAADSVDEYGQIGKVSFFKLIYKNGRRDDDGNSD